jgi:hypothetical protein
MSRNEAFNEDLETPEIYHDSSWGHTYDVSKAIKLFGSREPSLQIPVKDLRQAIDYGRSVNVKHAMTTDTSKPAIVAHHDPKMEKSSLLIDGWHRAYRASEEGWETLPAIELTPDETAQILTARKRR